MQFVDTLDTQMLDLEQMIHDVATLALDLIEGTRKVEGMSGGDANLGLPDEIKKSIDIIVKIATDVARDYAVLRD